MEHKAQIVIINADLLKIRGEKRSKRRNIKSLRSGIKDLINEQYVLNKYIDEEIKNSYDKDSLKENVERITKQIKDIESVIEKEEIGIIQLNEVIDTLENRKCQLEEILRLTGNPPQE